MIDMNTSSRRISFRDWCLHHTHARDNPRGDFLCDIRSDKLWDADPQTADELEGYLLWNRNACSQAAEEGRRLFAEYERWSRSKRLN